MPFEMRPVTASGLIQGEVWFENADDIFMAVDRVRKKIILKISEDNEASKGDVSTHFHSCSVLEPPGVIFLASDFKKIHLCPPANL